jgi:hypothetical protein
VRWARARSVNLLFCRQAQSGGAVSHDQVEEATTLDPRPSRLMVRGSAIYATKGVSSPLTADGRRLPY